jgi:hypothetical protein
MIAYNHRLLIPAFGLETFTAILEQVIIRSKMLEELETPFKPLSRFGAVSKGGKTANYRSIWCID